MYQLDMSLLMDYFEIRKVQIILAASAVDDGADKGGQPRTPGVIIMQKVHPFNKKAHARPSEVKNEFGIQI